MTEEIVWLGDIPLATLRPNAGSSVDIYYIHTDHLNTPRLITDSVSTAARWRWDAEPFGGGAVNDNPSGAGAFHFNLRFPGQIYFAETGLHYNYYRDCDPATSRYVQSDPIGLDGGINTYAYALNNPLMNVDPTGEESIPLPRPIPFPGLAGPAAGVAGAGWGGWQIGSAIYPYIERPLGDFIDNVCRKDPGREEDCLQQWISDTRWCDNSFTGRKNVACHRWAEEERERCRKRQPRQPFRL